MKAIVQTYLAFMLVGAVIVVSTWAWNKAHADTDTQALSIYLTRV